MTDIPKDYFCPKCNAVMAKELADDLRAKNMPYLFTVHMAINILADAKCDPKILDSLWKWAERYNETAIDKPSPEETDRLALVKWKRWAEGVSHD